MTTLPLPVVPTDTAVGTDGHRSVCPRPPPSDLMATSSWEACR
ncbi:hypothetical protein [Streptomyces sp. NPDC012756]